MVPLKEGKEVREKLETTLPPPKDERPEWMKDPKVQEWYTENPPQSTGT